MGVRAVTRFVQSDGRVCALRRVEHPQLGPVDEFVPVALLGSSNHTNVTRAIRVRVTDIGEVLLSPVVDGWRGPTSVQYGPRITKRLSGRGRACIRRAAIKAVQVGRPFRAMWTFTLKADARRAIERGDIRLSDEVTRVVKAFREHCRRRGIPAPAYCWVAENPNDQNPHVHMLTSWIARKAEFREFAAYIEALWGHGMVHMERLRVPEAAGRYLLKAAGYISKDGRGIVYGNRYGMSRDVRCRSEVVSVDVAFAEVIALRALAGVAGKGKLDIAGAWVSRAGVTLHSGAGIADALEWCAGGLSCLARKLVPDVDWQSVALIA